MSESKVVESSSSAALNQRDRAKVLRPCINAEELHSWVRLYAGIRVPTRSVCPGHGAPFDYVRRAYFEPGSDQVIWAPRGGGKTRLGAVATLLDLLHKPGCAVRILGGSLEQSLRMWEHLLPELERVAEEDVIGTSGKYRRITLANGSSAAVLTQSQRAVRGLRVQKLRCDEVELFDPDVWEAAQLITRTIKAHRTDGPQQQGDSAYPEIAGAVEALSTHHRIDGPMGRVIDLAATNRIPVVKWCLMEVLERCEPERECATCPLWDECQGVAKTRCDGFVRIDDAIAMKRRVSLETWESEMLCRRPTLRGCVFPTFDPGVHVREEVKSSATAGLRGAEEGTRMSLAIDFGFANPLVCLWVRSRGEVTHVVDEYVQEQRTVAEHLEEIESRRWGKVRRVACDPAGAGRNDQTAMSNLALLRGAGYQVKTRKSRIVDGLEMIRAALRPGTGEPRLFIHPRCARLIRALRAYRYPHHGGETPIKDGEHDHLIDALRYHYVSRASEGAMGAPRRY